MAAIYKAIRASVDALKGASDLATIKTHTVYLPALEDGVIVDLGANVGEFSCAMAARGLTCHAVEAVSDLYDQIPSCSGIMKHNLAIAASNEPLRLFTSENRECNSIHPSIASQFGLRTAVTVQGATFESFVKANSIDRIDLLKVDIEGSEEALFNSTSDELFRKIAQITIEFHDFIPGSISTKSVTKITERLKSLGFYCIHFSYLYPNTPNADVLFIHGGRTGVSLPDRWRFVLLEVLLKLQNLKSGIFRRVPTAN